MARKFKSSSYSKGMLQASTTYNVYYRRSLLVPNEEFIDFLLTHCKKNHIQKTKKQNGGPSLQRKWSNARSWYSGHFWRPRGWRRWICSKGVLKKIFFLHFMQLHTLVLHLRKIVIKVSKPATFLKLMFAHSVCNLFMYLRYTFLTTKYVCNYK